MPSEVVYGPNGVHVRVNWGTNEDGTVQIVTQAVAVGVDPIDPADRVVAVINEWLEASGQPLIDMAKVREALPYEPGFNGWWATLDDWGQVNRLIKALKRARDRQFGDPA